jgi:hypothetical protein
MEAEAMDNEKIQVGTLMRVYVQEGSEIRLSGVIGIVPEQNTTLLVRIPFFLKGASQVGDFIKSITNAGGRVEILRE